MAANGAPATAAPTDAPAYGLFLPSVRSPLYHYSLTCPSAGGISAPEAEAWARNLAWFESCDEPEMLLVQCLTIREADELYDTGLQGTSHYGVPMDPDMCVWVGLFEARVRIRQHPPVRTTPSATPTATPTSSAGQTTTPAPTRDPCPPARLLVAFEKKRGWDLLQVEWHGMALPTEEREPPATATSDRAAPTARHTPTVVPTPSATPTPPMPVE